ncbi:ADP compounds hydrolase NudE [Alkalisalibacterium limincola]|uniref:ADP compounds hydrolase NudE n=1 Tax=Alkalisalibacterium limincola TaxID=2699169 RepID=UPI0021061E78|nr:ADP compounds hydrolase NudE [Alkalisalibacterium limincola]
MSVPKLPVIHDIQERDEGRNRIEELDLEFSNGERRRYTRLKPRGHGAVIIAAMPDPETVLLIREYACGVHRYELGLPKGRIDAGESILEAANRELKEEAGFGGRRLSLVRSLTLAPTYMAHQTHLVLAEDIYPEKLVGDEPEDLEVVPWRLDRLHELMLLEDCSEGRSLAALFIIREYLHHRGPAVDGPADEVRG